MGYDDSTLLFANPGFFRGLGRAIDLGATRNVYNDSDSPAAADSKALRSDWVSVGKDLGTAVTGFGKNRHVER